MTNTILLLTSAVILSGCTTVYSPDAGDKHTSVLPSIMVCLASSCNGTWADRAERAGGDGISTGSTLTTKQTSDNKPNIPLSIGPGSPNAILK